MNKVSKKASEYYNIQKRKKTEKVLLILAVSVLAFGIVYKILN